nr:contractile injection system protein, VgrG/Pvc8 family [uncultured Desulfobacter sp.]
MTEETPISQRDIYIARPVIEVDGVVNDMVQNLLISMDLTETDQGMAAMELNFFNSATVEGRGNDLAFEYGDNDSLSLGKAIRVLGGDNNDPVELFRGTVTALEMQIGGGSEPQLMVLAEDHLQTARMTRRTRLFEADSLRSIIESVASDLGVQTDITGMDQQLDAQLQLNESDLAFLRRLIDRHDGELWMAEDVLTVAPRSEIRRSEVSLEMDSQLERIRIMADLAHQVSTVTFTGWDVGAGEQINVESDASVDYGPGRGTTGAQFLSDSLGERSEHLSRAGAGDDIEAQALVNAEFSQRARKFVCAEGLTQGNPAIRVGTHLTLAGVGPRFENTYFVTRVRHHFNLEQGYKTTFHAECAYLGG